MEIFNNYLMYKLLFDDKTNGDGLKQRSQGLGWRGSSVDVSQTRQSLRTRLTRRRSGSWNGPLSIDQSTANVTQDDSDAIKRKKQFKSIGRFSTFTEYKPNSQEHTPEIQITPVEKTADFLSVSALEKAKSKLTRKRSGSLPENQRGNESDKNKLAPPQRYEAPASLDPKRKNSEPWSSRSSVISNPSTGASIPPLIAENTYPESIENSPPINQKKLQQRRLSAANFSPSECLQLNVISTNTTASSSPSLLDLYISSSRRQSRQDDIQKVIDEMDSVVLDLGYQYNKPVQYAHSEPASISCYSNPRQKTIVCSLKSCSPRIDYTDNENSQLCTPPNSRALSREPSKANSAGVRRNPVIESVMRKLRSLKRVRPRARSAGDEFVNTRHRAIKKETSTSGVESAPHRRRWRFSKSKNRNKKMSPPTICVQNMMGSGESNVSVDKPKTSGVWHPPTVRPFERTLSYKRSTSAPSPRFSTGRAKSNAADYGQAIKKSSASKNVYDQQEMETLPSDPINDFIETRTARKLLTRSNSPLLQPGGSTAGKPPELLITMSYSQAMGFITATVNKARNVPQNAETFVRIHLFESTKVLDRKQTTTVAGRTEPEFKQAYVFTLANARLAQVHVLVELFSRGMNGKEEVLGNVIIGSKAGGTGGVQWLRMMKNANFPCSVWHSLSDDY